MFKEIGVVIHFAFKEAWRKKMMLAALVLTLVYLILFGLGVHFLKGNVSSASGNNVMATKMIATELFSMGLYMATVLTGLLAAFIGVGAISGEIESGTAYALLVKPVSRAKILLGKFLGYALMLGVYSMLFFLAIWGLFAWQFGMVLPGVWLVLPLFLCQPLIMLGLAFLGSTIMSTLANGITLFLLYGVALVGGMIEQIGAMVSMTSSSASTALINIGIVSSLLLPVDTLYRRAMYLLMAQTGSVQKMLNALGPFGSGSAPSNVMMVYTFIYLGVCLWLATCFFKRKDI
jgi:Cu-processing system permease protein